MVLRGRNFTLLAALLGLWLTGLRADSVLILPFEGRGRDASSEWISESIAESISGVFRASGAHVLSREERLAAFDQLGIPPGSALSLATVLRVAELAGADLAVLGQYDTSSGASAQVTITGRLVDLRAVRSLDPAQVTGSLSQLLVLQERLGMELVRLSGAPPAPSARAATNLSAWEQYIRGIQASQPAEQQKFWLEAVRLDPSFTEPAFHLGRLFMNNEDYRTALPWLQRVRRDDASYYEALFLAGIAYCQMRDWERAERAFREVLDAYPLNEVFNNLGVVLAHRGRASAAENFQKAMEGDSRDADYSFNLAYYYWKRGDFGQAVRRFRETLGKRPGDGEARLLLADSLERASRNVDSRDRPAASQPGGSDSLDNLERLKRNFEAAGFRHLQLALDRAGTETARSHFEQGRRHLEAKQYTEAISDFLLAAAGDPENRAPQAYLVRAYAGANRPEDALAAARRAIDPKLDETRRETLAWLALAKAYAEAGRVELARQAAEQVLAREEGNAEARALLKSLTGPTGQQR